MYEGASGASDITNGITTLPKKATESTQTDSSESAESLKKTLIDGYYQTNPEVLTPNVRPVMIDAEVDAEPRMTDGWVHMHPDTSSSNI
ncbi:unnamed protein product [Phytophthora lilii]|uniref:Unnamed protein product n=1 Tax=Phytophthora lilii TaxID=2077276 RepID=A0A9W6TUP1_9STRA|nr:unnamed protein product [Phytophthora lilii]